MKTVLDKLWAACWRSATIAWSYVVGAVGMFFDALDNGLGDAIGDPGLKQQIQDTLHSDPKILSFILLGISGITILARARSKMKKS